MLHCCHHTQNTRRPTHPHTYKHWHTLFKFQLALIIPRLHFKWERNTPSLQTHTVARTHITDMHNTLFTLLCFALAQTHTHTHTHTVLIKFQQFEYYSNEPWSVLVQFHHWLVWDFTAFNLIKAGQTWSLPKSLALNGVKAVCVCVCVCVCVWVWLSACVCV